jgi:hypothetical protein
VECPFNRCATNRVRFSTEEVGIICLPMLVILVTVCVPLSRRRQARPAGANSEQTRLCFQERLGLGWCRFATVRVDKTYRGQMFLTMPEAREPRSVRTN